MPTRTVKQTVILHRPKEGGGHDRIVPPIGKPFNFTSDELKDIEARNPAAIGPVVVEQADEPEVEKAPAAPAKTAPKAPGKPGKPAADEDL